jgi:hypothetical protein
MYRGLIQNIIQNSDGRYHELCILQDLVNKF